MYANECTLVLHIYSVATNIQWPRVLIKEVGLVMEKLKRD